MDKNFLRIMDFIVEIDKLKNVMRQSFIIDGTRNENDVEHSWHLAMMAILLNKYAKEEVDTFKVVKMVLIHDIVEIDAGDTFAYDYEGMKDKEERERKAADRIFAILPDNLRDEIRNLWDEFEEAKTPEAKFARAIDRVQPIILNYFSGGGSWKVHSIKKEDVIRRNIEVKEGCPILWDYALYLLDKAEEEGFFNN